MKTPYSDAVSMIDKNNLLKKYATINETKHNIAASKISPAVVNNEELIMEK